MTRLLAELEIDAACDDFLRALGCGNPQPIVTILDAAPEEDNPDWDELTAMAQNMFATVGSETALEIVERVRGRMLARMDG